MRIKQPRRSPRPEQSGGMFGGTTPVVTASEAQSEHGIAELRGCFAVTTHNVVQHMRSTGGSTKYSSIIDGRPNLDYVTVASGLNGKDELRLCASGFWVALHGGRLFVIGSANNVDPEELFPDLILLDKPSVATRSMEAVPPAVMESVLDPEIPIGDRQRTFLQSIEPHFSAYVTAHREQLLEELLGGLQAAADNLPPLQKRPRGIRVVGRV